MKVTIDEIVEALRQSRRIFDRDYSMRQLANRIEDHGIEQPSIDALIAEIDSLSPSHVNDEYGCQHSSTLIMYHACDIKALTEKYRGQK
jgi:hypothetical protein